jgi:hypothetical protein
MICIGQINKVMGKKKQGKRQVVVETTTLE